jgi:hypothetical protein
MEKSLTYLACWCTLIFAVWHGPIEPTIFLGDMIQLGFCWAWYIKPYVTYLYECLCGFIDDSILIF